MSLPSPEDTTVPPFTSTKSPSSPPPISIPFRFRPKHSLSPTAHDAHPHRHPSPADPPISPATNTKPTTSSRSKRKRSPSPADPSIPDPRPTKISTSPSSTVKPFRFKRARGGGASYRPKYPDVPTAKEAANRRSPSPPLNDDAFPENPSKPHSQTHHRSSKKPKRRRRDHHHSRRPVDDENPAPPSHENTQWADPDTAFRESLFDAMADDEGAAFWERVYGQPIHTYSYYYPSPTSADADADDPNNPKLEKMTEEEYVGYVRSKMYEKSHAYIFEERAKREARKREARKQEKLGRRKRWDLDVEEALRRGEERRRKGKWEGVWEGYLGAWNGGGAGDGVEGKGNGGYAERIRWPVRSGQRRDVGKEEIKKFFEEAPQSGGGGNVDLLEVLKKERVRWHPDKMQQRAGEGGLDIETTKLVTAVFQIIDRLWSEKKGGG